MALELESKIMAEIGFGAPPSYYGGSGSCESIRDEAAKRLPAAIRRHHRANPKQIILPNADLIALVERAAESLDKNEFTLAKTWQVAAEVIRTHMSASIFSKGKARAEYIARSVEEIRRIYSGASLPAHPYGDWPDSNTNAPFAE